MGSQKKLMPSGTTKATEMPTPFNREEMSYVIDGCALISNDFLGLKLPHLIPSVTCILTKWRKNMETPL